MPIKDGYGNDRMTVRELKEIVDQVFATFPDKPIRYAFVDGRALGVKSLGFSCTGSMGSIDISVNELKSKDIN